MANNLYKDSLFSAIFSTPEALRELYNAVSGANYGEDTPVEINTLSDVLFLNLQNDLSFIIDGRLVVFGEHQSTINNNMPIRMLLYAGRVYEKILDRKPLYRQAMQTIPRPEFFVLYNGLAPYPSRKVLRLSAAFPPGGLKNLGRLELEVPVFNITGGKNAEMLSRSRNLFGYSVMVEKVREFQREEKIPLEKAVGKMVKYCIGEDILADFLRFHGSEVVNMLTAYSREEEIAERRLEAWENGLEAGMTKGRAEGMAKGMARGRAEGKAEGMAQVIDLLSQGYTLADIKRMYPDTDRRW